MGFLMLILYLFLFLSPLAFSEIGFVEPWGKDSEMVKNIHCQMPLKKLGLFVKIAEQIILFHQNIISPVDGPRSHFRPGSSQYMLDALKENGFFKGYIMGCDRLLRENKEDWIYPRTKDHGGVYKWDPAFSSVKRRSSSRYSGGS